MISRELKDLDIIANEKRVAKRMKALNLKAKQAKKFKVTTDSQHTKPIAPNVLDQDFTAKRPNVKWVIYFDF